MQVESQWRLEEPNKDQTVPVPATPVISVGDTPLKDKNETPSTPVATEDAKVTASSEPIKAKASALMGTEDDKQTSSTPMPTGDEKNVIGDQEFEATQKDVDDHGIALGFSPGSPQTSSQPSSTPTTAANKFDKYYFQTLSSKQHVMRETSYMYTSFSLLPSLIKDATVL